MNYDGDEHIATGTATGVKNELLAGLNFDSTKHTDAGTYSTDSWTFTDVTGNYNNAGPTTITDKIAKVDAVIKVTPYIVIYDHASHTATGTATGVKGESLTGLDLSGTTHTNAGTYTDTWTFTDPTGNYKGASGTITDKIYYIIISPGFLQPINMDGSSIFKQGSTVPTKFQLKDNNGNYVSTAVATLTTAKYSPALLGDEVEAISTSAATTGNLFRVADNQYIFNLGTKTLTAGTYRITATLDSGQTIQVYISLKK